MRNSLIVKVLQSQLKAEGFRKKNLCWNRKRCDLVDVITLQKAKYSSAEETVFTINIGIFIPEFFNIIWGKIPPAFITEANCIIRFRLYDLVQGKVYGDAKDEWFSFSGENELASFSDKLSTYIEKLLLPYLKRFDSYESVLEFVQKVEGWQTKNPLWLIQGALLRWKCGLVSDALSLLNEFEAKSWKPKVLQVGKVINPQT